jgi:hypothetical protein
MDFVSRSILIILLLSVTSNANSNAVEKSNSNLEKQAVQYFQKGADLSRAEAGIEFLYKFFFRKELEKFVYALWFNEKQKYPDVDWQLVNREHVRIRVGNFLGQWESKKKKADTALISEIKAYVVRFRNSDDRYLRMQAVSFTVGLTQNDVEQLKEIVLSDRDQGIATMAVFAIAEAKVDKVDEQLKELRKRTSNQWLKMKIHEALNLRKMGYME